MPLLSASPHIPGEMPTLHSPSPCLVTSAEYVKQWKQRGSWVVGLVGWRVGRATNAIMMQVVAAWNDNTIIMILRECLHKCLLSGEAEGRCGGHCMGGLFFTMNKFMSTPVCCCSLCLLISYAAGSAARPKRRKFVNMNNN